MSRFALVLTCLFIAFLSPFSVRADDVHPQLGTRVWLAHPGESSEKLDVLFIPWGFADLSVLPDAINGLFYRQAATATNQGLFIHPPFDKYISRFNISFINQNIDENIFNCYLEQVDPNSPPKWHHYFICDNTRIKQDYAFFQPDYIVVLADLGQEYHASGGEIQYLNKNLINVEFTFVHEFAHQLGLADEYGQGSGQVGYWCGYSLETEISACYSNYLSRIADVPNLDKVGCPKWCESYDLNVLLSSPEYNECAPLTDQTSCLSDSVHCNWYTAPHPFLNVHCIPSYFFGNIGISCLPNTSCSYEAHYGQLAFKSGISIMSGGAEFNQPSVNHFESIFQCCFPYTDSETCGQFRYQMANVNPDTDYYMRIAYNKISSCASDATVPSITVTPNVTQPASPVPTLISLPGDANNDKMVDGIDYVIWLNNYDQTTTQGPVVGDFNDDDIVDGIDYVIWLNNYGRSWPS